MIQLLATKYQKHSAYFLAFVFYLSTVVPAYGAGGGMRPEVSYTGSAVMGKPFNKADNRNSEVLGTNNRKPITGMPVKSVAAKKTMDVETGKAGVTEVLNSPDKTDIDGPSQPEMSSFKPAGTNDMVNLFTGDFSYNIALMDVGGYPVNIFYDGGIGMEQEASWVGLGWNINPGNVNRNMRGVPDDFNGTEKLVQEQNMKRNITWGVSFGADLELVGIKNFKAFSGSVGASIGYSLNNYLGPAIELGVKGTTSFRVGAKGISEKGPVGVSAGLSANLNSRSGMTLTPNLSLSAKANKEGLGLSAGIGVSTSYNSRSGIKGIQLYNQVSMGYDKVKGRNDEKNVRGSTVGNGSISTTLLSSTISFNKPSYIPALRSVITNSSGAGRFQLGGAMFGVYPSFEVEGYGQVSKIETADQRTEKPMVGYLYAEKAKNNRDAVMDFTRFNDQEVTPTTTIISVPQYAYDVFSIQGEGTGGSIRAYRNDNGYVRDNYTASKDKSWSAGVDVGIPGHIGANFNTVKTPSTIGEWNSGNKLRNTVGFTTASGDRENVYFRNPGENSVLQANQYDSIGGVDLVRYKLGGSGFRPSIEPTLQKMNASGAILGEVAVQRSFGAPQREKRSQVVSFLTAEEASHIGLDKKIKNYNPDPLNFLDATKKLSVIQEFDRAADVRKAHHISQINVTEADGKRYVYGIPVYNLQQKDFTFTVGDTCSNCDQVPFIQDETTFSPLTNPHIESSVGGKDGYVQTTETPPYAHSFLLSGLLSPDYVDVNGDGITEDDLGGAVKFNYTKTGTHKWRTPLNNNGRYANSNPGNLSETRDDKAILSYGDRESWYLHSIESKTMIAFFTLEDRADGKGAQDQYQFVNYGDNSMKRLKKIDLYNKADLKKNGLTGAKPVKTVHFGYNYSLCSGTPDNQSGGKLTLERIWFTYNGQTRTNKNQYLFSYTKGTIPVAGENPNYQFNSSDRWGNYKPASDNPPGMMNRDFPYAVQTKVKADENVQAWGLKKILLPSGGQIEVEYESDDYAFVQEKRAATMSSIIGFSSTTSNPTNNLYVINGSSITENDYIFIKVSEACSSKPEVYEKYIRGMDQLLVKLLVNMPKGGEYMTAYASVENYDVYTGAGFPAIWIKMKKIEDKGKFYSPLSMTAVEFIRERLPAQAFKAYDVTDGTVLDQLKQMFEGLVEGFNTTFSRIPQYLRERGKAQTVDVNKSFARITDPDGFKYGGGHRVKKIMLKDNWNRMTSQYASVYGQEYNYTTKEVFNGTERTISSGVASYEPSIGGEENPYQSIVQISNSVPLGPTSYGAIEMPVLDAFFPAPMVGYSKVTVTSIGKKQNLDTLNKKTRSAVGRQVTEFYTAKDFPVYYTHTPLDAGSDKQEHVNPTLGFFYKYAFDARAISQGFLVATNDMHGKIRTQSSYAENDPTSRINFTENFYRNTGKKGFDDKFDFVHNSLGGEVIPGNMGIDIELMTDTREFSLKSKSFEIQGQVDWMLPPPLPLWLPFIWPVVSESENTYRAVTTTKVINYHAVLDSVVVIDKGSQVSTKNLVYDAETGQVVVNRTNNEFDKAIYSVSYPAYWAYSGMGLAYKNIDAVYTGVNFLDGKITNGAVPASIIESGDELYIINAGSTAGCDPVMASSADEKLIWALDLEKNNSSLTNINPDYTFIDKSGKPYSRTGVSFRIVRSGKRNMLGAPLASVALMTNPVDATTHKLTYTANSKVINASAVEYKEKWQVDNDVIRKYRTEINPTTCLPTEIEDCNGYLEKKINPYVKGMLGNFRGHRNMVFYGDRAETNPLAQTNLPVNGFLTGFSTYWNFNGSNNLVPDINNTKWVWNTEGTRFNSKGMELETKDALNIYTAAQYGYKKTLPVAIANNSRFHEMYYEGFEDLGYEETLNGSAYSLCGNKHLDLSGMANTVIESPSVPGFNAHTGKSVLRLNANAQVIKNISTGNAVSDNYTLGFSQGSTSTLTDPGGNATNHLSSIGGPIAPSFAVPYFSNLGMSYQFSVPTDQSTFNYELTASTSQYTEVTTAGTYSFNLNMNLANAQGQNSNATMVLRIFDINGNQIGYADLICSLIYGTYACDGYQNISLFMCPGIYLIETTFIENTDFWVTPFAIPNYYLTDFSYSSTLNTASYKSLANTSCTYTKPISASESMLNPVFSLPANKKMVFSAWVRESTVNAQSYTQNQVEVNFGFGNPNNVVLKPTGPIIEGWQRYEGYFTAPPGATNTELWLVNNSNQPIYFDDIRIHPFNSNMKSYVYDPVNLRLKSELDANNYASFYEYDEEGTLIRTKVETREGVKTVTESRSAKQKNISTF